MKKALKISIISISSLLVIAIAMVSLIVWFAFTPERLTSLVNREAKQYLLCETEVGEVELTFFSTFPQFGIKVNNLTLINPVPGAPTDTLLSVERFVGVVDFNALWNLNELILSDISLDKGSVTIYTDQQGHTNYNVFKTEPDTSDAAKDQAAFNNIDLGTIKLNKIFLIWLDESQNMTARVKNLDAKISGTINPDKMAGDVDIANADLFFQYHDNQPAPPTDSAMTSTAPIVLWLSLDQLSANISGSLNKERFSGTLNIAPSVASLNYNNEAYLHQALIKLDAPVDYNFVQQKLQLKNSAVKVNNLELVMDGTLINDTTNQQIITDVSYAFDSWPVKYILNLIPKAYHSYIAGIEAEGLLSSSGTIKGHYNDSTMPWLNLHLLIADGSLTYKDLPLPLRKINGDIQVSTDMNDNKASFIKINRFSANTPQSTLSTRGTVNNLFSDIYINLSSDAALALGEFQSLLPDHIKVDMQGNLKGRIQSAFSLAQAQNLQLEKMKLQGSLTASNLDVTYDSLWIKTNQSDIEFSLPHPKALSEKTGFAFARIFSEHLEAGKKETYQAMLQKANISVETSDARDTTRIPDITCWFTLDSLRASMDTLTLALQKPSGKLSMSPGNGLDQPEIDIHYTGGKLAATMGHTVADADKISLETKVINDKTQSDIFLQWLVKGFVKMDQGYFASQDLKYPVFIPSINMDFEPEVFDIRDSRVVISNSDFELKGQLKNILSYFRGDSLLKGDFNFVSNSTDLYQLMNLTNGLGYNPEPEEKVADEGPYMVPKGWDIFLSTNIKKANYLTSTASDIRGNVTIKDGILVLDELNFNTPAAKMILTAMYRTPRKNHLYLGIDYHMLNIEIAELRQMIPEVDSLMPMLRSFGGKGEYHLAVETYMDSTYNLKKSTIRGASSIKGENLVLMDGETFSEIAKKLKFKKKTENRVDSLSAEFTIFKDEIDVYPFLIVMDKYKAVIGGRHNFDLSFKYNISVVESPLPFRLGVDVFGNLDNFDYKLTKAKYAEFYRPVTRHEVRNKQLELRKIIRDALTGKLKKEEISQ